MGYLDGLRLLSFIRKPRKDPANLVNPVISKFLLDQFRLETEKTSCKSCQEQVLIRQDQPDKQEESSAIPEKAEGNERRLRTLLVLNMNDSVSQFRLETEKTSCKSCQEQVLIRQDQQDEQKKSFAFPDERQKGLLNVEMISTRFLKKAVNVDCLLPDNISSQDELVLSFVWKLRKHPVNPV
jgi:hypothetical protein